MKTKIILEIFYQNDANQNLFVDKIVSFIALL